MPEELVDIYAGLNLLQKEVQKQAKQPDSPLYFEKWIDSVSNDTQKEIKEKTGMTAKEFGGKIDKLAQIYRLYQKRKIPAVSDEQRLIQEYWSLFPYIFQKTGFRDALNPNMYQD